jgi:hypothetical protein
MTGYCFPYFSHITATASLFSNFDLHFLFLLSAVAVDGGTGFSLCVTL